MTTEKLAEAIMAVCEAGLYSFSYIKNGKGRCIIVFPGLITLRESFEQDKSMENTGIESIKAALEWLEGEDK